MSSGMSIRRQYIVATLGKTTDLESAVLVRRAGRGRGSAPGRARLSIDGSMPHKILL